MRNDVDDAVGVDVEAGRGGIRERIGQAVASDIGG